MLSAILLTIAAVLVAIGATLCAFAKSGEQETLGGVIVMFGVLALLLGGVSLGLGL